MQVRGRVGLLLGGLVLVGLLASGVVAQGAPGRIVQASDGTLYLLKDGVRYAIVGEPVEDDELNAFAEGGPVGAALLLNGLPAAQTAPETAVSAPVATDPDDKTAPPGTRVRNPEPPTQAAAPQFVSVQGAQARRGPSRCGPSRARVARFSSVRLARGARLAAPSGSKWSARAAP